MAPLCFLSLFIWTWCLVAGQSPEYVLKETTHVFRPRISGQPNSILWKHNGNKVVEFDGNEEQVYSPFVNRVTLDWVNADLEITGLRFEDSGTYEYEVDINNRLDTSEYQLKVIDKVSIPTISCDMNEGSSSGGAGSQATLMCSAKSESSPSFEWKSQGKVIQGQMLQITLGDQHDDEVHTCSVKNPLSSEAATFTAKECYPDNSPPVGLIVGLVVLVLLVVVLLVIIALYLRHKKQACFAEGDVENPVKIKGSAQDDGQPLIDQTPTLPSTQPLRSETTGSNAGLSDSANNHTEGSDSDYKTETESEKKPEDRRKASPVQAESENKLDEGQKASPVKAGPEASPAGQPPSSPTKSSLDTEAKKTDVEQEKESVSEQGKTTDEDENATSDQDGAKLSPAPPSSPLAKSGPGRDSDSPAEETNEELHTPGTGKDKGSGQSDEDQPVIDQTTTLQPPRSESTGYNAGLSDSANNHTEKSDSGNEAEKGQVQMNIEKFNRQSQTHHGQSPPTKVPASGSKKGPLPAPSFPVGASPSLQDSSGNLDIQKGDADEDKLKNSMDQQITKFDPSDSEEGKKQNTDSVQSDGDKDNSAPEDPASESQMMEKNGTMTVPSQKCIRVIEKHDDVEEVKDKIKESTKEKLPQSDHSDSQEGNKQNMDSNQSNEDPESENKPNVDKKALSVQVEAGASSATNKTSSSSSEDKNHMNTVGEHQEQEKNQDSAIISPACPNSPTKNGCSGTDSDNSAMKTHDQSGLSVTQKIEVSKEPEKDKQQESNASVPEAEKRTESVTKVVKIQKEQCSGNSDESQSRTEEDTSSNASGQILLENTQADSNVKQKDNAGQVSGELERQSIGKKVEENKSERQNAEERKEETTSNSEEPEQSEVVS